MKKRIVILYSGGLDSFILRQYAKKTEPDAEVICVYYNHGQAVAQKEIERLPSDVKVLNVDWLESEDDLKMQKGRREGKIMIPGRNLVMTVLGACKFLPDEVWLGALYGENHSKGTDKNDTFLEKSTDVLNYVIGPFLENSLTVKFPFVDAKLDKLGVLRWALANGISQDEILFSRSCHNPNHHACGNCIQCVKRWAIFGEMGFTENYAKPPYKSEFGKKFIYDMLMCELGKDDYYADFTRAEVLPYMLSHIANNESEYPQEIVNLAKKVNSYE